MTGVYLALKTDIYVATHAIMFNGYEVMTLNGLKHMGKILSIELK